MEKKGKNKRRILYLILVILIILVIGLFAYFILKYSNKDSNKYDVSKDSILYTNSSSYTTVLGEAYLSQKLDGYYYLTEVRDGSSYITKIAQTAISNNASEDALYIYGTAYQVDKNGEVTFLNGKTEVIKTSPSKFFKIADRKYLFVDSNIKSNENIINTTDYVIIDLDKEGNASFSNNNMNIKTIKPVIIEGSLFSFDIANENLIYGKNVIDLKKVLGSTNNFTKHITNGVIQGETSINNGSGTNNGESSNVDLDYYDEYFTEVINSVNNLSYSVSTVNENTKKAVKKGEVYFDFNKWIVLKSITPSYNSVTINYQIFDSNNEYQSIFVDIVSRNGFHKRIYLSKTDTQNVITNLGTGEEYTLSLAYQLVGDEGTNVSDTVTFITKIPKIDLKITKVTSDQIYFSLKTNGFKLDSGEIAIFSNDILKDKKDISVIDAYREKGFEGSFSRENLQNVIEIKLINCMYNNDKIEFYQTSKIVI